MAYTLLNDLRAGRCSNTTEVRLLRLSEARNINKGGELMTVDMLLIDENGYQLLHRMEPFINQMLAEEHWCSECANYTMASLNERM